MKKTKITLFGFIIHIEYQIHDQNYIEWRVFDDEPSTFKYDFLEMLLRIHYNEYIESRIREVAYYHSYSERVGAFQPEEDTPF